jgi:hypothetical protein
MRDNNEISRRLLQMNHFLQHGLFVVESGQLTKKQEQDAMKVLYQVDSEIELLRWVLGLEQQTWFDEIDKPECVQHL